MSRLIDDHRRACAGFSRVAAAVPADGWDRPTPCDEWDAAALVEHVIGFHDFLLLRPLGVRAHRPRAGPAARWEATRAALFAALYEPGALDRPTELPGGGESSPARMLSALTTDVLLHTWDLARAVQVDAALDPELCDAAWNGMQAAELPRATDMYAAAIEVAAGADVVTRLLAYTGRDPDWHA